MKITYLITFIFLFSCKNELKNNDKTEEIDFVKKTDVRNRILNRPYYKMAYPYNWKIDSTDQDYDIDSYFTLSSPSDCCSATFMFFNTNIDEKEHLDEQIKEHLKVTMKNGVVSYFSNWGKCAGYGAIIKGKLLGVFKGELKIFVHSTDTSSFLMFSQLQDQAKLKDEEALNTIETSFRTK